MKSIILSVFVSVVLTVSILAQQESNNKTIGLIDVLWLRGNGIAAAFEIESTTPIIPAYSEYPI